jgi:hypothetical protein
MPSLLVDGIRPIKIAFILFKKNKSLPEYFFQQKKSRYQV